MTGSLATSAFAQTGLKADGLVTYEDDRPFANAQVTLYSLDRILQTTSDVRGHFQFDRVPFGVYQLVATAPAFKTKTIDGLQVTATTRSEDLQFKIMLRIGGLNEHCSQNDNVSYRLVKPEEGSSIIGTVLGDPQPGKARVANAHVSLLNDQGVKLEEQITNDRGEFQFKRAAPGHYEIEMHHASYNVLRSTRFWVAREDNTFISLDPIPLGKIRVCE